MWIVGSWREKERKEKTPASKAVQWLSRTALRELWECCWKQHEDDRSGWPPLAPHFGQQSWEKGDSRRGKEDPFDKITEHFCRALRTPAGEVGEEADSRKYRNISLDRWIFLYRSNPCFLPASFLTPRMTPAAPHSTAGSSFLKGIFSRC